MMRARRWTMGIAVLAVGALLVFGSGLLAATAEAADGAAESTSEGWKGHRWGRGWSERPAAGLFIRSKDLDELVKSLAERTGLSEDELRKAIEDAGRTVPERRGEKKWGRGWHRHHHHHHHYRRHHHRWMDRGMGPRHFHRHRGEGPGEFPMHPGMGPGEMRDHRFRRGMGWDGPGRQGMGFPRWWMEDEETFRERISPELMTPQLEEALERLKAAGSEARAAVTDMIRHWGAAMEARLDAMEAWLEAVRESGTVSEERYERMKARYEAMREWYEGLKADIEAMQESE